MYIEYMKEIKALREEIHPFLQNFGLQCNYAKVRGWNCKFINFKQTQIDSCRSKHRFYAGKKRREKEKMLASGEIILINPSYREIITSLTPKGNNPITCIFKNSKPTSQKSGKTDFGL